MDSTKSGMKLFVYTGALTPCCLVFLNSSDEVFMIGYKVGPKRLNMMPAEIKAKEDLLEFKMDVHFDRLSDIQKKFVMEHFV
jgi:hypothetical protein